MVEGGKSSTTPAMAQTLGPLKMDMQGILKDINEKTSTYQGLKVPVELNVVEKDKTYEIIVKSPPASELIKSELKIPKGSSEPEKKKVANISVEQLIKVAKMKMESLFTENLRSSMSAIAGTCNSLGVLIEGNDSRTFNKLLNEGKYDEVIKSGKTETDSEKIAELKSQLAEIQEELDKKFAKKREEKEMEEKETEKAEVAKEGEAAEGEEKKTGEETTGEKVEEGKKEGEGDKK